MPPTRVYRGFIISPRKASDIVSCTVYLIEVTIWPAASQISYTLSKRSSPSEWH